MGDKMNKSKMRFLILLLALIISLSLLFYIGSIDTDKIHFKSEDPKATAITFDNTRINEGDTIVGHLVDYNGNGIANKTIIFHKPGYEMGTLVTATTDSNGEFRIENAEYLPDSDENYYGFFSFGGDDDYDECVYENNLTIIPKSHNI